MLNILGIEEKKKILIEYRLRLATVSIFAIATLSISSVVLFTPSYLLAVSKYNENELNLVTLEEKFGNSKQEKEMTAQIRDINGKISLLSSSGTSTRMLPSQAIVKILDVKGSEIKIQSFTYDATTNLERIGITGVATGRESMASFVDRLKKEPMFTSVVLPISSYVKSTDIDFYVVIERKSSVSAKK